MGSYRGSGGVIWQIDEPPEGTRTASGSMRWWRTAVLCPPARARSPVETDGPPSESAVKAEWVAYAISLGADAGVVESATKAELIEQYGS